ncbi:putative RNA binding protein HABP4/SERBP1 [Helianthus annuus]|nr:putative RNA binding protein HABP4/SERBP1 [Helianthus annuus]
MNNRGLYGVQGVIEESDIGKGYERHDGDGSRGGRHGGFANEDVEDGDHPRRSYERRSGIGYGQPFKGDQFGKP